ncbi:hypothetical protein POEJIIAE_01202 [Mannheimia haemolytica]
MKVYGENACISLFQQRPESIVRLWATVEGAKKLGDLMSYLAQHKKPITLLTVKRWSESPVLNITAICAYW